MFTGLIETRGTISSIARSGSVQLLGITPAAKDFTVARGGSVSVDGACLTLEREERGVLHFAAVPETMARTTLGTRKAGDQVNLERALVLGARLDGHLVLGHVDGVGRIRSRTDGVESRVFTIELPVQCEALIAEKGSVTVDGISLTVAKVDGRIIDIAVIPATLAATTLGEKRAGDSVNIEADVLARYVRAALAGRAPGLDTSLGVKLERYGF